MIFLYNYYLLNKKNIKNMENFENIENKISIFSYGSNSISQLRGRLENLNLKSYPAYVDGYKRIFCGHSHNWGGGVATLIKKKYIRTYGSIVYLDKNELSKLDSFEKIYTKEEISCKIMINNIYSECKCLTYIANDNKWSSPPSEQYLVAINMMLYENFSDKYIIISKLNEHNKIENIQKWTIKNINELSLISLFVIVNQHRVIPWRMPKPINSIVYKLNSIDIFDIDSLKEYLIDENIFSELNNKLEYKYYSKFSNETFFILKKILNI
jgi:hypothetical protein